jgi:hypothetical protein
VVTPGTITTTHGTVVLAADGSFTYTPTVNYNGTDTFTYRASDGTTTSNIATVTITVTDKTAPTAAGVQTTNGGTVSRIEQDDTIVYTFSEPIRPESILTGWNGSTTNVVVRVYDGDILLGLLGGTNDSLQVYNATNSGSPLLGTVNLGRQDYVTGLLGGNVRYGDFGGSDVPSTMTMSGNTVTVVLGSYNSIIVVDPARQTAGAAGTMVWTPTTTPKDLAGNSIPAPVVPATEPGLVDRDF